MRERNASPISHRGFLCLLQIWLRAAESCWSLLLCLTKEAALTLNPTTAPSSSSKAPGKACSSPAGAGCSPASISPGAGAVTPRRGLPRPSNGLPHVCGRNTWELERSSMMMKVVQLHTGYSWKPSVVHTQRLYPCRNLWCWEVPEHPPLTSLQWVCSWWRVKKRLFSLVLWLFAMEGSFCGGGQNLKSRFAWVPVVVLTLLHCAVASTLRRPEWQCGPWMILGTQAVPANLQAYKTASWVICTKKKRSRFKNKRNTWTWFNFTFYLVFKLACSF